MPLTARGFVSGSCCNFSLRASQNLGGRCLLQHGARIMGSASLRQRRPHATSNWQPIHTTCNIKLAAYQGSTQQSGSTNSATLNPVILAATSLVADPHFAVTAIRHTYIHFPVRAYIHFHVRDGPYSMSSLIPKPGGKWGCFQTKPEGTAMSQEGALPKEHVSPEAPLS